MSDGASDKVGDNGYADSAEKEDVSDFNWRTEYYKMSEVLEQSQDRLGVLELSLSYQRRMLQYYAFWMEEINGILDQLHEGAEVSGQSRKTSQRDELDFESDEYASTGSLEEMFVSGDVLVTEEFSVEQKVEQQLAGNSQ